MIEMASATRTRLRGRELRGNGDAGWNGVDSRFLPAFAGMTGNDGKGHSRLDRGKDGWGHEPRLGGAGRHADAGTGARASTPGADAGAPARFRVHELRGKDGGGNGGRELTRTSRGNGDAGAGPRVRPPASVTPPPHKR